MPQQPTTNTERRYELTGADQQLSRPELVPSIRALTEQDRQAIHEILGSRTVIEGTDDRLNLRRPSLVVFVDNSITHGMRGRQHRFSDWVLIHPVVWALGSGAALVLLGLAVDLAPILIVAAGATIAVLNILHAKQRGYCPVPKQPNSHRGDLHDR